jgi:hypothetical protein
LLGKPGHVTFAHLAIIHVTITFSYWAIVGAPVFGTRFGIYEIIENLAQMNTIHG